MATSYSAGRVLLTATALASVLVPAQGASAQDKRPPTPVKIVESVPLPVSGTVTIGGPTSVTVANPESAPIPVRDVDRTAREAFQVGIVPTSFAGSFGSRDIITVPAGKRLVIEYASAWVNSGGAGGFLGVTLSSGSQSVNGLACVPLGQNALNYTYACAGPTKQYVEAGETLRFTVETFASAGGFFRVFVAGHYEAVP